MMSLFKRREGRAPDTKTVDHENADSTTLRGEILREFVGSGKFNLGYDIGNSEYGKAIARLVSPEELYVALGQNTMSGYTRDNITGHLAEKIEGSPEFRLGLICGVTVQVHDLERQISSIHQGWINREVAI